MAAQVVLADGEANRLVDTDPVSYYAIKVLYEALLSRDVTRKDMEDLFKRPWILLPDPSRVTDTLNIIEKTIAIVNMAA